MGLLPTDWQMKPDILQLAPDYWKVELVLRVGLQSGVSEVISDHWWGPGEGGRGGRDVGFIPDIMGYGSRVSCRLN